MSTEPTTGTATASDPLASTCLCDQQGRDLCAVHGGFVVATSVADERDAAIAVAESVRAERAAHETLASILAQARTSIDGWGFLAWVRGIADGTVTP